MAQQLTMESLTTVSLSDAGLVATHQTVFGLSLFLHPDMPSGRVGLCSPYAEPRVVLKLNDMTPALVVVAITSISAKQESQPSAAKEQGDAQ